MPRQSIVERSLLAGTVASVLSTGALVLCGRLEKRGGAAPTNATSQWVWGEQEAYERRPTLRHTLVGYAIHHAMAILWAAFHEGVFRRRGHAKPAVRVFGEAAATAALAYFVDYHLTPRRLRPGFEKHLGSSSFVVVYGAFALGLALVRLVEPPAVHRHRAPPGMTVH